MRKLVATAATLVVIGCVAYSVAQSPKPGGPPPLRRHTVTESKGTLSLVPATERPRAENEVSIELERDSRVIRANGIPDHLTGPFPNRGNPHSIAPQKYVYAIPAKPQAAERVTPLRMQSFGIAVNGVPFDPGAAEWYLGHRDSEWRYEPLAGAVPLGVDAGYAHVQPSGAYHYHGLPKLLLARLHVDGQTHSPIVGWAADGFPMYALYGYAEPKNVGSKVVTLRASYRLKKGMRPTGQDQPGGRYDGTFLADYEYVKGSGDLDECNGRACVTPDYPDGTYAYFLTEEWPVIPRIYRGTPSRDFERRGPPGRPRPR